MSQKPYAPLESTKSSLVKELNFNDENNSKKSTDSIRHRPKIIKNNFLASSPIRDKFLSSTNNESTCDLTKVSIINDQTPLRQQPRKSSSPLSFNNQASTAFNQRSLNRYSLETCQSMQMPSVISSVSSTITSVTQTNTVPVEENGLVDCHQGLSKPTSDTDYEGVMGMSEQGKTINNDLIESDEILRILFKKNYFYQMKLK